MNLTFIDTETTGIKDEDVIIQLGLINEIDGEFVTGINSYFNNGSRKISLISKATHGILEDAIMHLPVFSPEVPEYKTLEELNPKTIFVGHNVVFDISMISKFGLKIEKYIDNLQIAKHLLQEEEEKFENSYRQEVLKYYLMEKGISFPEAKAHDAMGDVQIARVIFKHFFDLIGKRYDLNSNDAIISKMLELSGSPILLLKFNFGKYKGTTFEEVAWNDLSYIDWLYRNSQDENIRFTCGKYL